MSVNFSGTVNLSIPHVQNGLSISIQEKHKNLSELTRSLRPVIRMFICWKEMDRGTIAMSIDLPKGKHLLHYYFETFYE